jgi:uncharacterized DUF497 family protein
MNITYDPAKRARTLAERGLDFVRADEVFTATHRTVPDDRTDYGESRFVTIGWLDERMVVLVWTPRLNACRVISMRKANEREIEIFAPHLA